MLILYSGSKLVIKGQNLDSAHKTIIQYTPKTSQILPLQQVSELWFHFCVKFFRFCIQMIYLNLIKLREEINIKNSQLHFCLFSA